MRPGSDLELATDDVFGGLAAGDDLGWVLDETRFGDESGLGLDDLGGILVEPVEGVLHDVLLKEQVTPLS